MSVQSHEKRSRDFSWGFVALVVMLLLSVMGNLSGVAASVAPRAQRCNICGVETAEWYTVTFAHGNALLADVEPEYIAPFVLCPDCAGRLKNHAEYLRKSIND